MWFQKNAWMDRTVMAESAQGFCDHIKKKWGNQKVLLFCDNLDAHVCENRKKIFAAGNVFLYCLPPTVTEAIQAIDAGYGRSVRCAIGRGLDAWLQLEDNMALWESEKGLSAAQRRVLISRLVSEANKEAVANDSMRVGCFERTGMLLTLDGSDDDKIRPQGLSKKFLPVKVPAGVDLTAQVLHPFSPETVVTPEEKENGWSDDDGALHDGDEFIDESIDVVVDEEVADEDSSPSGKVGNAE